jgi:hypothetical protein
MRGWRASGSGLPRVRFSAFKAPSDVAFAGRRLKRRPLGWVRARKLSSCGRQYTLMIRKNYGNCAPSPKAKGLLPPETRALCMPGSVPGAFDVFAGGLAAGYQGARSRNFLEFVS